MQAGDVTSRVSVSIDSLKKLADQCEVKGMILQAVLLGRKEMHEFERAVMAAESNPSYAGIGIPVVRMGGVEIVPVNKESYRKLVYAWGDV